MIKKFFSSIN